MTAGSEAHTLRSTGQPVALTSSFRALTTDTSAPIGIFDSGMGGLEVTIPIEINDPDWSGAHFDAGTQVLNGAEATLFARIRHAYDDMGDGDRYRAANQRQLISVLIQRIMRATPVEMVGIINALAGYVNTDMPLDQIVNLALAMRGIDVNNDVYTTMNPTESTYENDTWYEMNIDYAWRNIMATIDAGGIPEVDEYVPDGLGTIEGAASIAQANTPQASTSILVKDATGDAARSAEIASALQAGGWQHVTDGGEANIWREEATVVVYDEFGAQEEHARSVAEQIGAYVEPAGDVWGLAEDVDVMIVTGAASYQSYQ